MYLLKNTYMYSLYVTIISICILECLTKTPPPVLIFAERKSDVDSIHEYLLLKGKPQLKSCQMTTLPFRNSTKSLFDITL